VFLGSLGVGGTYATDVFFQAARAASLIRDYKVTSAWPWFPAVMQGLYAQSHFVAAELTHITSIMLIGPESLLRRVQADFPGALHLNACGMTESAGMYAQSARGDTAAQRATTGGVPVAGFEAKIIDPDTGREVPADMKGEILVRGYSLMDGYFRDPERTAEALDGDGWLHTGDLYARSESGHLTFHGRLKDMLKVGGENVPAIEVEAFLCSHPAVKLAEVVGRPDSRLDEVPVAFVELHPGTTLSAAELIDFCRGRIASFKIPRAVYFKQSHQWPVSTTKINKTKLRAELDAFAEPTTTV
jgi:acyl-CoA synthetase (AMP-forming)/AMP-acid ligase II